MERPISSAKCLGKVQQVEEYQKAAEEGRVASSPIQSPDHTVRVRKPSSKSNACEVRDFIATYLLSIGIPSIEASKVSHEWAYGNGTYFLHLEMDDMKSRFGDYGTTLYKAAHKQTVFGIFIVILRISDTTDLIPKLYDWYMKYDVQSYVDMTMRIWDVPRRWQKISWGIGLAVAITGGVGSWYIRYRM